MFIKKTERHVIPDVRPYRQHDITYFYFIFHTIVPNYSVWALIRNKQMLIMSYVVMRVKTYII